MGATKALPMQQYNDVILARTSAGSAVVPLVGASISVFNRGTRVLATLFADKDGVTSKGNPFESTADGRIAFYAADGRYDIEAAKQGYDTIVISDVLLEDPADGSAALSASGGSALVGFLQSGAGAVARTVQTKLREIQKSAKDNGCVGDGSTNDYANFITSVANYPNLKFPAGTYKLPFTGTIGVVPPANAVWEGDGKDSTILRFEPHSATFRNLIALSANGLTLRNITVTVVGQSGQELVMIAVGTSGGNLILDNARLNGAMTNTGSTLSHLAHAIGFPTTGTQAGFYILPGSEICGIAYGFLKANGYTSNQSRIKVIGARFHSNYYEDCAFNSPSGTTSDVVVAYNTFDSPKGESAGLNQYFQTFASITNFSSIGNVHTGKVVDAIHIEENCRNFAVVGNTGDVDGIAISLLDNNISGTAYFPRDGSVSNNHFRKSGTTRSAGSKGVYVVFDGSAEVPAKSVVISGNTMYGFATGCDLGDTLDDVVIAHDNIAEDCTTGWSVLSPSVSVRNNVSKNCDVGVVSIQGGVVVGHTFLSCTLNADAQTKQLTLLNPNYIFPEFAISAGATTGLTLTSAGANDGFYGMGTIVASAQAAPTDTYTHVAEITWDGTTFTNTTKLDRNQGGGVQPLFARSGSNLLANVFSASARSDVRVHVSIQGAVVVAA